MLFKLTALVNVTLGAIVRGISAPDSFCRYEMFVPRTLVLPLIVIPAPGLTNVRRRNGSLAGTVRSMTPPCGVVTSLLGAARLASVEGRDVLQSRLIVPK